MKLKLEENSGISILHIEGEVSAHHFEILSAGIEKFLKDGKNQIIISMGKKDSLEAEAVRKISDLNTTAKELSGEIVLVIPDSNNRKIVESFSNPPLICCYGSLEESLDHFKKEDKPESSEREDSISSTPSVPIDEDVVQTLEKQKSEITALKKQLGDVAKGELKTLKDENLKQKGSIKELEKQVEELLEQRRTPPSAETYEEKVGQLEGRLNQLVTKIQEFEKAAASKA